MPVSSPHDLSSLPGAVVVTGGAGAIGSEVCRQLAAAGARIAIPYRGESPAAQALVAALRADRGEAVAWPADLAQPEQVAGFTAQVLERFGAVHTLVHAAGPYVDQQFLSQVSPDRFQRQLIGEAAAFFNVVHPLLPALREQRGAIVAVTSCAIRRYPMRDGLSSGPKGAIESTVKALAVEEGRFGVRANCVAPGILEDGMAAQLLADGQTTEIDMHAARSRIPLQRLGRAKDVAAVVCFLVSPAAQYVTGQTIDVDGGYTL